VIVITDRNRNFGQNDFVKHRGIRYAIKIGIAREQWRVAILIPGKRLPEERKVSGTRQDAETAARSMINAWLKKRPAPKTKRKRPLEQKSANSHKGAIPSG
jgi:hypothetical protein